MHINIHIPQGVPRRDRICQLTFKKRDSDVFNIQPIGISRNDETYDFRNAGSHNFRNAGNYNCPKYSPLLFPEMLAIIISRNVGSFNFPKILQL